jgi:hypothetical protein
VVRAVPIVALDGLVLAAAREATVLFDRVDFTGSGLGANAAGHGAVTERTPSGHFAVNRAGSVVASAVLQQVRALLATVHLSLARDVALATLVAGATGLGAFGPRAEGCDATVNGTVVSLASSDLLEGRAGKAFELGSLESLAGADLLASAARLGASTPVAPLLYDAVNGARIYVAFPGLLQPWAHSTLGLALDVSGTDLTATAAGLVTLAPLTPLAHDALDGAWAGITSGGILDWGTCLAAANHRLYNHSGAVLAALAALGVTEVEGTPSGHGAVHSAGHGVAIRRL